MNKPLNKAMTRPVLLNCRSTGVAGGENIVILHGLFGDLNNWRAQAERLSDSYRVHSMDLRNHGDSPHTQGMSYPEMAADVAHTCQSLQIEKTHVIGHSMGGKTAMQLAGTTPDLIERLVVVDIGPRQYPHHHQKFIEGLRLLSQSQLNTRRDADTLLKPYVSDTGVRAFLLKNLQRGKNSEYTLRVNIEEIANKYDAIAAAIQSEFVFNKPVLFIKGAESDYLTKADRSAISALFSNPALKTIDSAGHWPHSEKPDVVYKIVSDFLAAGSNTDIA